MGIFLTFLLATPYSSINDDVEIISTCLQDFKCLDNGKRENLKSVTCDFHLIGEAPESTSSLNGNYSSVCLKHTGVPHSYIYNGIKMTLLIGLLTSQGSQQAIADTEIAGRMQSLDYFGDLGDINTGFASVRKASL